MEKQQKETSVPNILKHLDISPTRISLIQQSIEEDQGKKDKPTFFKNKVDKLTVSLLEDYTQCPFIFSAKHHFGLWDGPDKDMDMPPLERGILIHKLFEIIMLRLKRGEEVTEDLILEMLETLYLNQGHPPLLGPTGNVDKKQSRLHPLIWEKEKARLLKKALRFLKHERETKIIFNNFKPLALEKKYKGYWNLKTKSLSSEGDIIFEGKIDRIDSNQQAYHIIDYKNQLGVGSAISYWSAQERFQMAVYAQAVQQGLADLPALPVLSALYLSYKDFSMQGMALKMPAYIQLLGSPRKKSLISEEDKKSVFRQVNQQIQKVILNMQKGLFPAQPKAKKLCEKCRWRKMCRATHLN